MDKIFYVDNNLLGKCNRCKWCNYTIVMVVDKLTFDKVKVSTWEFDIRFAYAPINHIGYDVVKENDIRELNWYNILNDFNNSYHNRKYIIWEFLRKNYPLYSGLIYSQYKDELQTVYWGSNEIDKRLYDKLSLPNWCKNQDILWKIDCAVDYMIDHDIEKENAIKLKELIRTDPVTITTEEYLRIKGYIN